MQTRKYIDLSVGYIVTWCFFMFHCSAGYVPGPHSKQDQEFTTLAKSYLGIAYQYGGNNRSGMDCSGLVYQLYKQYYKITLPHNTYQLYKTNQTITYRALKTGDLVFFRENRGSLPSHVGIYLGENEFIHTSGRKGVIISSLKNMYYKRRLCGFKRVRK